MIVPLILIVILSILAIFFTSSNQSVIEVIVFGYTINGTVGLLIVGALGLGLLLGIVSLLPAVGKRSFDLLRRNEELAQMKQREAARKPEIKP